MLHAFLGFKQKQTRTFTPEGVSMPVTIIATGFCTVIQIKKLDTDGYWAVQLGIGNKNTRSLNKALAGHLKQAGLGNWQPRFLREVRFEVESNKLISELPYKVGDKINASDIVKAGDTVSITGTTKAKGFQGVVKRHGFSGGPRTHGQSDRERAPGSIGQTTTPGRVYKGKRMAGRAGGQTATVSGLTVVAVDSQNNTVTVKGLVPGGKDALVVIEKQ